jgi:hypothetical protein
MITIYPDVLRKSTMIKLFRARGAPGAQRAIEEIEKVHRMFPACIEHGRLEDPIIAVSGKGEMAQIAICCPSCSSPEIRAAYDAEGNVS